jgi:hypothetical protein
VNKRKINTKSPPPPKRERERRNHKRYENAFIKRTDFLTLLTETRVDVKECGRNSESLVSLMAVSGECQTDGEDTDSYGHSQPQSAAERRDVSIPTHVRIAG